MNRDAWGGHSQRFRKWGTQITPTPATRKQVEKFKQQWNQAVKGTPTEGRSKGKRTSSPMPPQGYNRMMEKPRGRSNMPLLFRKVLAPSNNTATAPAWSPVAGPLSSMAQLSKGMLPLSSLGKTRSSSTEGMGETQSPRIKGRPIEDVVDPMPSTSRGPMVSPISSCEDIPELIADTEAPQEEGPIDLSYREDRKDLMKRREEDFQATQDLEKERKKLQDQILGMDIKIEKLESISPEQYKNMGNILPPPQPKEEPVQRFLEPPSSPRNEEEMEVEPHPPAPGVAQSPPQEPEVQVVDSGSYSTEEEDVKETRRTSWTKRREAAQRKKLCLRLVRHKIGPNSLEVYQKTRSLHLVPCFLANQLMKKKKPSLPTVSKTENPPSGLDEIRMHARHKKTKGILTVNE